MPVLIDGARARLEGECVVDEAETLYAWLVLHPEAEVELDACTHLHAALLQVLMACPCTVGLPRAPGLRALLEPLFSPSIERR